MRQSSRFLHVALFATLPVLFAFAGCGNGDNTKIARVSGTVTYKGKPVPNMTVNFMPPDGRPSWGKTDADGKYDMTYDEDRKGVKLGRNKVFFTPGVQTIDSGRSKESKKAIAQGIGLSQEEMTDITMRFGSEESTKLEVDVKKDPEVLDLKLD
jgi:hypothetical protein